MKKGFTLIELTIVIIIIGLLTHGALNALKYATENAQIQEHKKTLNSAELSVDNFILEHNRLPTVAEFDAMNFKTTGNSNVYYESDASLQTNLCAQNNSTLTTTNANGVTITNVGYVLATGGGNTQVQTNRVGNNILFPEWNTVVNGFPYDDLHSQKTLKELQTISSCEKLEIINPSLYSGTAGTAYFAEIIAKGGSGTYAFSLSTTASGLSINPTTGDLSWNNPIVGSYALTISVTSGTFPSISKDFVLIINPSGTNTGNTGNGNGGGNGNGNNGNGNGNGG